MLSGGGIHAIHSAVFGFGPRRYHRRWHPLGWQPNMVGSVRGHAGIIPATEALYCDCRIFCIL